MAEVDGLLVVIPVCVGHKEALHRPEVVPDGRQPGFEQFLGVGERPSGIDQDHTAGLLDGIDVDGLETISGQWQGDAMDTIGHGEGPRPFPRVSVLGVRHPPPPGIRPIKGPQ